jgi:hypothetical protein
MRVVHRSEPPPETPESIRAAMQECLTERAAIGYEPPSADDWARLECYQGLENLVLKLGATRVMRIVRNIAHALGQECQ